MPVFAQVFLKLKPMERLDCRKYHAIANMAKVTLSNLTQQLNSWPKTNAVYVD